MQNGGVVFELELHRCCIRQRDDKLARHKREQLNLRRHLIVEAQRPTRRHSELALRRGCRKREHMLLKLDLELMEHGTDLGVWLSDLDIELRPMLTHTNSNVQRDRRTAANRRDDN